VTANDNLSVSSEGPLSSPLSFSVTWDYRCPFARNAHEHLLVALEDGADFDVTFVPFSLSQAHVEEGEPSVFDDASKRQDLLAMEVGLVVRDQLPERFYDAHRALFALRHDEGADLRDEKALRAALDLIGIDGDFVFDEIGKGWPLETLRREHEAAEQDHTVWGVPTFIVGPKAAFVRVMSRPEGDAKVARQTIEQIIGLFSEAPALNEFKHTTISN
jgi:2-hydroxychromene-2-carboxylate isomerase